MIGNDQLLYVADTRANRIVMMNTAGQILSSRHVLHPLAIAQDSRLDLLVTGVTLASNGDSAGSMFRIHLVSADPDSAHRLEVARLDTVWRELARPQRRFPGITVLPDNSYLVVRNGPDNSSSIDPDARVIVFDSYDHFVSPIPSFASRAGGGITDINFPTSIASFPGVKDFVLTQAREGVQFPVIWMQYQSNSEFEGWLPKFDPAIPEQQASEFLRIRPYVLPQAVAIDKGRRDVFIADAALDSVLKFTSRGTFRAESFGRIRSNGLLRRPTGLAFFEKVLYVLDAETGWILRYRLSTDVPR